MILAEWVGHEQRVISNIHHRLTSVGAGMIEEFPDSSPLTFICNRGMQGGKLRAFLAPSFGTTHARGSDVLHQ